MSSDLPPTQIRRARTHDSLLEAQLLHEVRNVELTMRIAALIGQFAPSAKIALDVGAQTGEITSALAKVTGVRFWGIDRATVVRGRGLGHVQIIQAAAENLPFREDVFDVVTLLSVYEHFDPQSRRACVAEMHRVLRPGGSLIGQIPNMYFPIEPHSRLPLQSYLPPRAGELYFKRFSNVPWKSESVTWYRVGPNQLKKDALWAGFRDLTILRSSYSSDVFPSRFSRFYRITEAFPLNFDFAFRKPEVTKLTS